MRDIYLYSGAGNTFVVLDGRKGSSLEGQLPCSLCAKYGTDGLMVLKDCSGYDFGMEYYNSDGSGGMMCGNGGRCIVAFADYLGIRPAEGEIYRFLAPDGEHSAEIIERETLMQVGGIDKKCTSPSKQKLIVRLKMKDVDDFHEALDGEFVDTGTRHFVKFVQNAEKVDIEQEGRRYRYDPAFAPAGVNANFVQGADSELTVRTYEKGVEAETLACGTGITASAIAAFLSGFAPVERHGANCSCLVHARQDDLKVEFTPIFEAERPTRFEQVFLTGPAELTEVVSE